MRFRKVVFCIIVIFITSIAKSVFADDNIEDNINFDDIENILLESTAVESEEKPNINSRHAVIYDRVSGTILYGKNENEKCKMASTTKIMSAIIVLENQDDLEEKVKVSSKAAGTGGSRLGLKKGDEISINDLLYGLLLCSGNDAAVALAEHIGGSIEGFSSLMNEKGEELKLTSTNFVTPHGLDQDKHYTTAYELAKITDYALKNGIFEKIVKTKNYTVNINGTSKNINNTNELLGYLNGVYGVKTGFTNGANRCLVTAIKRNNMDIISVVLGADTKRDRTKDSIKIIEYAFSNYEMIDMRKKLQDEFDRLVKNTKFDIEKGINNNLKFTLCENDISLYPVDKNSIKDIKVVSDINKKLISPVNKKDRLRKNLYKYRREYYI